LATGKGKSSTVAATLGAGAGCGSVLDDDDEDESVTATGARRPVAGKVSVGAPGATSGGANKNPKMGYAIGYLRKTSKSSSSAPGAKSRLSFSQSKEGGDDAKQQKHEYQMISDTEEDLGGPLDLGPSLLDEVSEFSLPMQIRELRSTLRECRTNKHWTLIRLRAGL